MNDTFLAFVLRAHEGVISGAIEQLSSSDLPKADVTVAISFSSLNYKDGLILKGKQGLVKTFPMIPGIDFAGTVLSSSSDKLSAGDRVVLTGWGVGERWWGGFAQRASVKSDWLVRLPEEISLQQAMRIGTAGITAMLSILALERNGVPRGSNVLVTGASGGVGSIAIKLLATLGYQVTASTGRMQEEPYLRALGAGNVINRDELAQAGEPLQHVRWQAAIDSVGGQTLANVLAQVAHGGSVAACGLAGGTEIATTVYPFILRGVSLLGIDSVECKTSLREEAWSRLSQLLKADDLAAITQTVSMSQLPDLADRILAGKVRGRVVVDVNA